MTRTRRSRTLAVMLVGMASVGLAQAQAQVRNVPPPLKPTIYRDRFMVNTTSRQCLVPDVGAPVVSPQKYRYGGMPQPPASAPANPGLAACNFYQPGNQLWKWVGVGKDSKTGAWDTFVIQSASNRSCLGVEQRSLGEGAPVALVTCNLSDPSQMWIREGGLDRGQTVGPISGWVNVNSGKCLTIWKGQEKQIALRQFSCQGHPGFGPQEFYGVVY